MNLYQVDVLSGEQLALTQSQNSLYPRTWFPNDDRLLFIQDNNGNELFHLFVREENGDTLDLTPGVGVRASFLNFSHDGKYFYATTNEPSNAGSLLVRFKARPKPTMVITVRGCLTCKGPMLERRGGDISKGRFFLFKMPKDIKIRRGRVPYDFGNINIASYEIALPKGTTEKKFKKEILPHL